MGSIYDSLFALGYERSLRRAEAGGLSAMRRDLLHAARGRTLEIGAGTGLNLEHYTDAVTHLVLTEPSRPMLRRLGRRTATLGRRARVVEASCDRLPFEAASFDTVVSTLVLCTVPEPLRAVREIRRVLAPGGSLLYLEHVRSQDPRLAAWQDRLAGVWKVVANGCVCNRDLRAVLADGGLDLDALREAELRHLGPLVRPAIVGAARRAGPAG